MVFKNLTILIKKMVRERMKVSLSMTTILSSFNFQTSTMELLFQNYYKKCKNFLKKCSNVSVLKRQFMWSIHITWSMGSRIQITNFPLYTWIVIVLFNCRMWNVSLQLIKDYSYSFVRKFIDFYIWSFLI